MTAEGNLIGILKGPVIALACIAVAFLLYGSRLPQYGDGAIGTLWVYMASFAAYVVLLLLALPSAVLVVRRGDTIAKSAWLWAAIACPPAVWLLI